MSTNTTTKKAKLNVSGLLKKQAIHAPADLGEAQAVAGEYATLKLEVDKLNLACDSEVKAVKEKYAKAIEERSGLLDRCFKRLRAFFSTPDNRERHMGAKKSYTINNVECSWRQSPGKTGFTPGLKEEDVVAAILESADDEAIDRYLDMKPKLDKSAVLEDWGDPEARALLQSLGVIVATPELFSVTPLDRTEITPTQSEA